MGRDQLWLVSLGNFVDGVTFCGPFADIETAHEFCASFDEYQITEIMQPSEILEDWVDA